MCALSHLGLKDPFILVHSLPYSRARVVHNIHSCLHPSRINRPSSLWEKNLCKIQDNLLPQAVSGCQFAPENCWIFNSIDVSNSALLLSWGCPFMNYKDSVDTFSMPDCLCISSTWRLKLSQLLTWKNALLTAYTHQNNEGSSFL